MLYYLSLKHLLSIIACWVVLYNTKLYSILPKNYERKAFDWKWIIFTLILFLITPDFIFYPLFSFDVIMVYGAMCIRSEDFSKLQFNWGDHFKRIILYSNIVYIVILFVSFNLILYCKGYVSNSDIEVFEAIPMLLYPMLYLIWFYFMLRKV